MTYDDFVGRVQQLARLDDPDKSVRAIHATLSALAEHLSRGEARDLSKQLPLEFAPYLHKPNEFARAIPLAESLSRIGMQLGVSEDDAGLIAGAVMITLREAIDRKELQDIFAQLPEEYDLFFHMP
jgi:uncharacterized protein (DUF2267 family)